MSNTLDTDTKKYIEVLQADVVKLQAQLCKSEETVRKLQTANAAHCKVPAD